MQNTMELQHVGMNAKAVDPQQKEYTRRAAANLISRLRDNPSRLQAMPALEKMVKDDTKKSELITMLCESNGCLEKVGANLEVYEERLTDQSFKKKALRWTKKEMEDHYGADAEAAMKHKREQGLTEDDENCPGALLYLISRTQDEFAKHSRSGALTIYALKALAF